MSALLWPMFDRSVRALQATVLAGKSGDGAALASVRSVVVGSASHYCGGLDRRGRCSGLFWLGRHGLSQALFSRARNVRGCSRFFSFGRRELSQPLMWRSRQVWTLLWPLILWSAWVQLANLLVVTIGEGASLDSVRLFGVGQVNQCGGRHDRLGHSSGL